MPMFYQFGRRHSPSRRNAIILPQEWNVLSASMPSLSSYQDSEADNQDSAHLTFYHHSNESTITLVPRPLSQVSAPSSREHETFFHSDSDSSTSSIRRTTSPTLGRKAAARPASSWSRRWPFSDDNTTVYGDFELGYPEIDTLGPLRTLFHELNDISLSADRPLARLDRFGARDQRAQWMQRCQILGEKRVTRRVERGNGKIITHELVREGQSVEFVGFAEGEAKGHDAELGHRRKMN